MDANLFTEGAIYYYENKTNSKQDYYDDTMNHDFLVSRPVYILKKNESSFDEFTVNVLVITSSKKRIGIDINIDGFTNGKILPYNIRSLHKEYLTKYMGHASEEIMKEVNQAVAYHMKYTDEKPKYLIEYEKKEKETKERLNALTLQEKSIYRFIKNRFVFNDSYYVKFSDMFNLYMKADIPHKYNRSQEFSRALNKLIPDFPGVTVTVENRIKLLKGLSINGDVHKISTMNKDISTKKSIVKDIDIVEESEDIKLKSTSQLYKLLDSKGKEVYNRLDIIGKLSNYSKTPKDIDVMGATSLEINDLRIIKQMIVNDVEEKKLKVLHILDNGVHPLSMNFINQYVIYICSNNEIMDHISERHLKKGGIDAIRRNIRKNIKIYLRK